MMRITKSIFITLFIIVSLIYGCESSKKYCSGTENLAGKNYHLPQAPNIVLLYYGVWPEGPRDWSEEKLKYYLAYYQTVDGRPQPMDTFFDTVLCMYLRSSRGRTFEEGTPTTASAQPDWQECLDRLFLPDRQLNALEKTTADLETELHRPMKINVILTLPYPSPQITDWSEDSDENSWNFYLYDEHRFFAIKWFITQALDRWNQAGFKHLELLGFYWFAETHTNKRPAKDFPDKKDRNNLNLMRDTARYIHSLKVNGHPLTLTWIPCRPFGDYYLPVVKELMEDEPAQRIDYLMIQPNYFFPRFKLSKDDLHKICRNAGSVGSGIEIECNDTLFDDPNQQQKLLDYLAAPPTLHPHWNEVPMGCYQGCWTIYEMATRPEMVCYYDKIYQFVKSRRKDHSN